MADPKFQLTPDQLQVFLLENPHMRDFVAVNNSEQPTMEVQIELVPSTEQTLQSHLETLKSTYSEEFLRSRFAEKGFDLEKYVFEVLHKEIVVISELAGDKNRMTDGFIYAEGNLDVLKRALREVKMGNSYNIYSIFETASEVNVESIPDEFCGNVVLKTLALGELKPIIESEYKKHRIDAKQVHLGIKESKVAELSQKVGDEIAALKIARRELTRRINSGESVQNRLTATSANIKSERAGYSDIQTQERTQSITTVQPAEKVRTDPTVLAGVAKRLLEQRGLDQETKIIKTVKDTTQDPSPAPEQPVPQIDLLQEHQELLKPERLAEDLIVKGFELRIANYNTEKEIAKLRIVNKELLGTMKDHTIQIPTNLNLLLGKINKFKDGNQAAMVLPRLRNILIEKASDLGIKLDENSEIESLGELSDNQKLLALIDGYLLKLNIDQQIKGEKFNFRESGSEKKAIELFQSIIELGGIKAFISETSKTKTNYKRFGGHHANGKLDGQYIIDVGRTDRIIFDISSGNIEVIGQTNYHK
jgi:hypothetical protein